MRKNEMCLLDLSGSMSGFVESPKSLAPTFFETCQEQDVPSIFGERKNDKIINIYCINCCQEILNFFKCSNIWGPNGIKEKGNTILFEIPKSLTPFLKSFDMVRMLQRWNVMIFDFDKI